jgi:hypothetical protein
MMSKDGGAVGVLVQFIGSSLAVDPDLVQKHLASAKNYVDVPGFIAKTFLADPSTDTVGGFYTFETEEQARALFATDWWREAINRTGVNPTFRYFSATAFVTPDGVR